MRHKIVIVCIALFFTACSTKLPNTLEKRIMQEPPQHVTLASTIKGSGEAFVMLHGFGSSKESFNHLIEPFSTQYNVHAIDLKGFGDSPIPKDFRYSAYDQALHVMEYINAHHLENVILLGHSYGGSVALVLASLYPEKFSKLILVDPAAYHQQMPSLLRLMQIPVVGMIGYYLVPISYSVRSGYKYVYFDDAKISEEMVAHLSAHFKKPDARYVYYHASFDLIPEDIEQVAKNYQKITIPTLIIWGREDIVIPRQMGYRLKKDLPNAEFELLPYCGHIPQEECPQKVIQSISKFLQ